MDSFRINLEKMMSLGQLSFPLERLMMTLEKIQLQICADLSF